MNTALNNLVFIANGWGSSNGGINAFNYDLCLALGKISEQYHCKIYCVCSGTVPNSEIEHAADNNVEIITVDPNDFGNGDFSFLEKIIDMTIPLFWIGHDIITGEQAAKCGKKFGGKIVVLHHMDYEAYYSAKGDGQATHNKMDLQRRILEQAHLLIGVGPKLYQSLKDKFPDNPDDSIGQIMPGLADIKCVENVTERTRLIFTGRVEDDNDCVKQFKIIIQAFGKLVKERDVTQDSSVTLIGMPNEKFKETEKTYKEIACEKAEGFSNLICRPYTQDRDGLFDDIRRSSIAVMPSLSEGFGLVGLEAISAGVPLVLTKNSGLYHFLEANNLDGFVDGIDVRGYVKNDVNDADVENLRKVLKDIVKNIESRKKRALELKEKLLQADITWQACAQEFLNLLCIKKLNGRETLLLSLIDPQIFVLNDDIRKFAVECACTCDENFVKETAKYDFIASDIIADDIIVKPIESYFDEVLNELEFIRHRFDWEPPREKTARKFLECSEEFLSILIEKISNSDSEANNFLEKYISRLDYDKPQSEELFSEFDVSFRKGVRKQFKRVAENILIKSIINGNYGNILNNYHSKLTEKNSYLDFDGLSIMISNGAQRIPLDEVFADMDISSQKERAERNWGEYSDKSLIERLTHLNRVIILGDPGSGKSTLMKKLIMEACNEESRNKHGIAQMCVSIHISEFSNWLNGNNADTTTEDKLSVAEKYIEECALYADGGDKAALVELYRRLKMLGGIIYFIDGLDEVKNAQEKSEIKNYIFELVDKTKDNIFIMTSRKVGFDDSYAEHFAITELEPLSTDSIIEYINKWYKAIGKWHEVDDSTDKILQKAPRLISIIESESSLRALAGSPLLLSIIVILHYHGINLPNNKVKLYETISTTLLGTWIEKRGITDNIYDADYLTGFFSEVGFEIIKNNYDNMLISETMLRKIYVNYVNSMSVDETVGVRDRRVDDFITYISELAGILLYKGRIDGEAYYGFLMHRQFTEYYAAIEMEGNLEYDESKLSDIISEPKWIEVFILMGCYMSNQMKGGKGRVNKIINSLLVKKSKPMPELDYNLQLVFKLMANNVLLEPGTQNSIKERLTGIFENKNHFKILQLREDLLNILSSAYNSWFIKFLGEMLNSDNYICKRNACILISYMYQRKRMYDEELKALSKDSLILNAFADLVDNEPDKHVFFTSDYSYYHSLFMAQFINYANSLSDDKFGTENYKEKIYDFISYLIIDEPLLSYMEGNSKKPLSPFDVIVERANRFARKEIREMYIVESCLRNYVYKIAAGYAVRPNFFDTQAQEVEIVRNLKNSADELFKIPMPDKYNSINWAIRRYKICHYKTEGKHNFIIFLYDRKTDKLIRHDFSVGDRFTLNDIRNMLATNKYTAQVDGLDLSCLLVMRDLNMSDDDVYSVFNDALDNGYVLNRKAWHGAARRKIAEDESFFYNNYNELINRGIFKKADKSIKYSGIIKIYASIFSSNPTLLSKKSLNSLIKKFNEADDDACRFALYDIINKVSNPFRLASQEALYDVSDF